MSRHHRTHRAGWDAHPASARSRRLGVGVRAAVSRAVSKCIIRGRCRVAARTTKRSSSLCRVCHLQQHHKPDPARRVGAVLQQEFA